MRRGTGPIALPNSGKFWAIFGQNSGKNFFFFFFFFFLVEYFVRCYVSELMYPYPNTGIESFTIFRVRGQKRCTNARPPAERDFPGRRGFWHGFVLRAAGKTGKNVCAPPPPPPQKKKKKKKKKKGIPSFFTITDDPLCRENWRILSPSFST